MKRLAVLAMLLFALGVGGTFSFASSSQTPLEAAKQAKADADATLAAAQKADASAAATVAAVEASEHPKEEPPPSTETWHNFTASNPMPGTTEPFGPESFINRKITNSEPAANSAGIVSFVGTPNSIWTDEGYGRPLYYSLDPKAANQVLTVSGVKYGTWANGLKLNVPVGAKPAVAPCWPGCGGDHHMTIVEPSGVEYDFWAVTKASEGQLVAGGAGYAANFGTSSGVSEREAGSTASGFNNITGSIRPEELAARHINHALAGPVHLTKSGCHLPPAKGSDGTSGEANAPCQGQHLCLRYTNGEIEAKHFAPWKQTMLIAIDCEEYGYYVDDSGGSGGFTIKMEAPVDRMVFGLPNPFNEALKGQSEYTTATGAGGPADVLNVASGVDWTRLRAIA